MASNDDAKVWVRMPKSIHALVSAQAERERRSVNAQILVLLERMLEQATLASQEPKEMH